MSSSEHKLVESIGKAELWEVFDPTFLYNLDWSEETINFGKGYEGVKKTIDMSDRIGYLKIGDDIVGGVGFRIKRMQPEFWFGATNAARNHTLAIVRFFAKMKRKYPHFTYTVQNERLIGAIERWASLLAEA